MNINWQEIKEKNPKALNKFGEFSEVNKYMVEHGIYINICYCDLEEFFDDIGIDLLELLIKIKNYCKKDEFPFHKKLAKEQAIYKAFEIFEEQLKDK